MKRLFYVVVFLIIFVFGLTFAARNPQSVSINYYFGVDIDLPLTVVLLSSLVLGVLIGYVAALGSGYKRYRRRLREARADASPKPGTSVSVRGS